MSVSCVSVMCHALTHFATIMWCLTSRDPFLNFCGFVLLSAIQKRLIVDNFTDSYHKAAFSTCSHQVLFHSGFSFLILTNRDL